MANRNVLNIIIIIMWLVQKDIEALSQEQGLRGTLIKWWDLGRNTKEWIDIISKLADRHI